MEYCWAGQKVCSGFSIASYRKIQINFLANPIFSAKKPQKEHEETLGADQYVNCLDCSNDFSGMICQKLLNCMPLKKYSIVYCMPVICF